MSGRWDDEPKLPFQYEQIHSLFLHYASCRRKITHCHECCRYLYVRDTLMDFWVADQRAEDKLAAMQFLKQKTRTSEA